MSEQKPLRPDLQIMADWVKPKSRILDIGCGDGELMAWLMCNKQVDARGLEIDPQHLSQCLARGVSVLQGDANEDLTYYPSHSVDYAILGHTLQRMSRPDETLKQLVRIGKYAIVSVPNFAYWKNRLHLLAHGRMPVTKSLNYEWYETPNIHFCSLTDLVQLCESLSITIEKRIFVTAQGKATPFSGTDMFANLLGEQGIFLLRG